MGKKGSTRNKGIPVVIKNDTGQDIVQEELGTEVRYTKDYGLGLDVHSTFIEVNVLVKNDLKVFEYRKSFNTDWISVNKAKEWALDVIRSHSDPPVDASLNFHYTLESTSSYHFVVIKAWNGSPSIVNPTLAKAGMKKTDILDAATLSLSDLTGIWPSSYIPGVEAVELRMLVDERRYFMNKVIQIGNRINNSLLKLGINFGRDGSVTQNGIIRSRVESLITGETIDDMPDDTVDVPPLPSIPEDVRCVFQQDYEEYDHYKKLVSDFEDRILAKVYSMQWETGSGEISGEEMMKILTSAPGIGIQTAVLWLTRVITPRRFPNEKAIAAYCGCDPSLKVSAGKVTSTAKRGGRKDLHSQLCMAASNLMRRHSEPFGMYGYKIAVQTGIWKKGVCAVARKLICALYFMALRNERFSYEKYKMINEPEVLNVSIEILATLNPAFKRYVRYLYQNDIRDTKTLVHKFFICELSAIKGLGKNFFALLKDFINDQKKYRDLYERLVSNENGNA